jgi:hypothetical protein
MYRCECCIVSEISGPLGEYCMVPLTRQLLPFAAHPFCGLCTASFMRRGELFIKVGNNLVHSLGMRLEIGR